MSPRFIFKTLSLVYALLLMAVALSSCEESKYRIAMSQCQTDCWYEQLDKDLLIEANTHPELSFSIKQAHGRSQQQIADVETFLAEGMDLLIIAPNDMNELTPVIEKVYDQGIPVILLDRRIHSDKYTASLSSDNIDIGNRAAAYSAYVLQERGQVIEVLGTRKASSCIERHKGFAEAISRYPEIEIIDSCYCDWTYDSAYHSFDSLFTLHPDVDLVFAANDVMAKAVYQVCADRGLAQFPDIIGVDGLAGEGQGVACVAEGKFTATCINPTGGVEAIDLALDILNGRPYQRDTKLKTAVVFQRNAPIMIMMQQQRDDMLKKIEEMNGSLNQSWHTSLRMQRFLITLIVFLLVLVGFIWNAIRNQRIKVQLRQKLQASTETKLSFFSNVSQSFRTPVTLIVDPLEQLIREGGFTERQEEILKIISRNAHQLVVLSDKIVQAVQPGLTYDDAQLNQMAQDGANGCQRLEDPQHSLSNDNEEIHAELLSEADSFPQQANDERSLPQPEDNKPNSILIIDDNPGIRQYISLMLGNEYYVLQASNGKEGLEMAQKNIPDIIICDMQMPVMDGLECCRQLRESETTSFIPVVMLTAYCLDDQRIQAYKCGADSFMTKPFSIELLRSRLQNLLETRRRINPSNDRKEEMQRIKLGSVDRSLVERFHNFIITNISNVDLGIPDLCEEFNMSRVQVYRKFKSLTGQSPVELIRIIRLKRAKELLESSDMSVSEVAYDVGFSSASYFTKCYRDQFNETPTEVQRRVREK